MKKEQTPYGGRLINKMLKGPKREKVLREASKMPAIAVDPDIIATIEMIATGVLSPLEGFMGEADYKGVLFNKRLANGLPWTVPITFAPMCQGKNSRIVDNAKEGDDIALINTAGEPVAILHLAEKYGFDREERARQVFGTTDRRHPGVDYIYRRMGGIILTGTIDMIDRPHWGPFEKYRIEPTDTWRIFYEERKWRTVAGFQTANPIHRGHEYLQKCALEILDGLFIHPIVETTRKAYFRNEFRLKSYEIAINTYYPKNRVVMAPLRVTMTYAGPREAILHAIIRRNFGCTHFIVGRDHAGFGGFYDKYAAWRIFDEFEPEELGITPLFFKDAFYCTRCAAVATEKTCPHGEEFHITMSGTGIQDILRYGYIPPKEILRPEVAQIIIQGIQPKGVNEDGVAIKPPGDTVKGLFPFYVTHHRLGGHPREEKLESKNLALRDIEIALFDVRNNAAMIYDNLYREIAHFFDTTRNIANRQRAEAHIDAMERQKELIAALEEKVKVSEEKVSDPFMYQDRAEALKELEVAKRILEEMQTPVHEPERFKERVWNPMEYSEYSI